MRSNLSVLLWPAVKMDTSMKSQIQGKITGWQISYANRQATDAVMILPS